MEQNEERKMKLKGIPYFRIWANLFNYKARENKKDFFIDLCLFVIAQTIFCALIYLFLVFDLDFIFAVLIMICGITLVLQSLSLFARRLNDIGMNYGYTFFLLTVIAIPFMIAVCLGKSKDELDEGALNKKTKIRKRLLTIPVYFVGGFYVLCFILLIGMIVYDIVVPQNTIEKCTDIDKYEEYVEKVHYASDLMPDLDDLTPYLDIKFGYKCILYSSLLGFVSDDISLFVTYGDNYNEEKEKVLNYYDFLKEDEIIIDSSGTTQFPLAVFDYKGYTIRIVPNRNYYTSGYCSCKSFMMIGYNDLNSTIVYLYFYDFDIDYLYDEEYTKTREKIMQEFIDEGFVWYE